MDFNTYGMQDFKEMCNYKKLNKWQGLERGSHGKWESKRGKGRGKERVDGIGELQI